MTKAGAFGVCMPKLARIAPLAIAGVLATMAPASALDLCAGLRQAMAHAAADFRALKLAGERGRPGAEPARTLLPGGNRCEVREAAGHVEYRCRMTRADAPPAEARAAFRRDVRRMRNCFANLRPRGAGDYTGATEWTGAVIWQPQAGVRAAVVFFVAETLAFVSAGGKAVAEKAVDDDAIGDETASWIVIDKVKPRR